MAAKSKSDKGSRQNKKNGKTWEFFPTGEGGLKQNQKRGGINFGDQIPNLLLFKKFYLTKKYINKILKHCYSY